MAYNVLTKFLLLPLHPPHFNALVTNVFKQYYTQANLHISPYERGSLNSGRQEINLLIPGCWLTLWGLFLWHPGVECCKVAWFALDHQMTWIPNDNYAIWSIHPYLPYYLMHITLWTRDYGKMYSPYQTTPYTDTVQWICTALPRFSYQLPIMQYARRAMFISCSSTLLVAECLAVHCGTLKWSNCLLSVYLLIY